MAAGKCFRLFTAWAFNNEMEAATIPEVCVYVCMYVCVCSDIFTFYNVYLFIYFIYYSFT